MASKAMIGLGLNENVSQGLEKIEESIEGVSSKSKELEVLGKRIDDLGKKSLPVKRELKQLEDIMANMNLQGLTNTDEFTRAATRAGELKDALIATHDATRQYGDGIMYLNSIGDTFTAIAATGTIATGVMGMFGVENEKVGQILLKVQSAQSILNGCMALANALDKDSALMLKIKQIRMAANTAMTQANTVATTANTVANTANTLGTKKSTVAQTAWNVAKAVAKALMGDFTGLLLVGVGAVTTYAAVTASSTSNIEDNTTALKENSAAMQVVIDAEKSFASSTASNFANLMKSYDELRDAWNKLKTTHQKNQFLSDNKTKIQELTTAINDIDSAESVFNDKTGKVVKAFTLRAKAAAAAALQIDMYKKAMEAEMNMKYGLRGKQVGEYTFNKLPKHLQDQLTVTKTETKKTGKQHMKRNKAGDGWHSVQERVEVPIEWKVPDNASTELLNELEKYGVQSAKAAEEYKKAMELANEEDAKAQQLQDAADKLLAAGKTIKDTPTPNIKKEIESTEPKVEVKIEPDPNSLQALDDNIKALQEKRVILNIDSKEFEELGKQIEELERKKINIEAKLDKSNIDKEIQEIVKSTIALGDTVYDFSFLPENIAKQADDVVSQLDRVKDARERLNDIINDPNSSDYKIAEATSALAAMESQYQSLTAEAAKFNDISSQIKERQTEFENFTHSVEDINNVVSSIDAVKSSFESFSDAISNGEDAWDIMMAGFETGMSILSAVTTVMEIINAIQDAQNIKKALGATTLAQETAAHTANSVAQSAETATTTALGIAQTAAIAPTIGLATAVKKLAASQIFLAHASIPFAGPGIAAAGVATMEATLAAIQAFANGGIVTGSSTIGDHMIARVNAGEMILNDRQQANLFKMLNEGAISNKGNVNVSGKVKIRGKDMDVLLSNYDGVKKVTGHGLKF